MLKIDNLTIRYPKVLAVDNLSLELSNFFIEAQRNFNSFFVPSMKLLM